MKSGSKHFLQNQKPKNHTCTPEEQHAKNMGRLEVVYGRLGPVPVRVPDVNAATEGFANIFANAVTDLGLTLDQFATNFKFQYVDDEGDLCTVGSVEALREAARVAGRSNSSTLFPFHFPLHALNCLFCARARVCLFYTIPLPTTTSADTHTERLLTLYPVGVDGVKFAPHNGQQTDIQRARNLSNNPTAKPATTSKLPITIYM
jgi:hypothetical protein